MANAARQPITVEEYLAMNEASETKLEFIGGRILAMAGGSARHALISAQLIGALAQRLRGGPCRTYSSDLMSSLSHGQNFVFPDVTVICGEEKPGTGQSVTNPTVVFEVLSPTTATKDRGIKAKLYRETPSLKAYVFLEQDRALVELISRSASGEWVIQTFEGMDSILQLSALEVSVPLSEIYENVDFTAETAEL